MFVRGVSEQFHVKNQSLNYYKSFTSLSELDNQNRISSTSVSESPPLASLPSKAHRDQYVRCNPTSDRIGASGSGADSSNSYKAEGNEYVEDICPYATFQLNKQTYSESSYSGNVYSGPYHSVRGSFVYHDVKTDTFQVREEISVEIRTMKKTFPLSLSE